MSIACHLVQRLQVAILKLQTPNLGFRASSVMGRGIFQDFSILECKGHPLFLRTLFASAAHFTLYPSELGVTKFFYILFLSIK